MDLIYMNANKEDLGVLLNYELDLAFGADENNFECRIQSSSHCCQAGYYLYIEGTEYGGIIDTIESDTANGEVIYSGRTWHGILGSRVILPLQSGEASTASVTISTSDVVGRYLTISGDANACIGFILNRVGLTSLFKASEAAADAVINGYQFNRYTDAYSGLFKMLSSAGLKLHVKFKDGMVVLSAVSKYDYSDDEEFNSDAVEFHLKKNYQTVNHLICLGSGDLENRTVVHLYADGSGNISQTQTLEGMDEYVSVFDYSSAESESELIKYGKDRLKELWSQDELSIDFDADSEVYDIGDTVGAADNITGITVAADITKKIVTIKNGQTTISYEVGE